MIYSSKVGYLPLALLSVALPFAIGLYFLISGDSRLTLGGWGLLLVGLAVMLFLLLFAWPVTYDPGATRADGEPVLRVRCGLLRGQVPLAQITEVGLPIAAEKNTTNLVWDPSSTAFSFSKPVSEGLNREIAFESDYREP
jgi:hypothetical protein